LAGTAYGQSEPIGKILMTKGTVEAVTADGSARALRRRSDIFENETITTDASGFAQIRMVDEAIISLKENSEFRFDAYTFSEEGQGQDRAVMNLVRGGFRTIDGLIGEDADDEYRVDTQYASIGVRGTTHEAFIDQALDALFTGVSDGGTTVTGNTGLPLDLGAGADFDYSQTNRGQAPVGLLTRPVQLGRINITPPQNGDGDQDDADAEEESDSEAAADDDNDAADDNSAEDNDDAGVNADDDSTAGDDSGSDLAVDDDGGNDDFGGDDDSFNPADVSDDDGDEQTLAALNDISNDVSENDSLGSNNAGNSDSAPGTTVAAAALAGNPGTNDDSATETEGVTSTNVDVQINPSNNVRNANSLTNNWNSGRGNADDSADDSGSDEDTGSSNAGNGNSGNSNGNSGNSNGNSGNSNGNSGNGNNSDDTDDASDDSDSSGNGNSGNSNGNSGNSNGNSGSGNDDSDDDASDDRGNSGNSNGNSGNSNGNSGNSNGNSGSGNDDSDDDDASDDRGNSGNSNGNSGNSNGNSGNSNSNSGSGSGSSTDTSGSSTSASSNGNSGNSGNNGNSSSRSLLQSDNGLVRGLIEGLDDSLAGQESQVMVNEEQGLTVLVVNQAGVVQEGGLGSSASVGDLTIDWGYWSLPGLLDKEQSISQEEFQRVYLAVVDPADMDDLKSTSGSWHYSAVQGQFTGSGTAGTLTSLDMAFDVDLNSGSITNGNFAADVAYGAESWSMNFQGSVQGATATMDGFSNAVVITPAGISHGIEGQLGGVFTGAGDTNGFVSGFSLTGGGASLGGLGLLEGTPK
jgi:hypothetical protein